MSFLVASQALQNLSPEDKANLVKLGSVAIQSAPIAGLAAAVLIIAQWNLEHLSLDNSTGKYMLRRLSTKDTSILNNSNLTPISPPVMSLATRLADSGADTAEAALSLAQQQLNAVSKGGLIGAGLEFIFGK